MAISHTQVIPSTTTHITLVPSQFFLQTRVASEFSSLQDGGSFPAPAVFIFSQWIKDISFKSDLLNGHRAAFSPAIQQVLMVWARAIARCRPDIDRRECLALARQARAADRLINQWLDEPRAVGGASHFQDFLSWRKGAQQAMQDENWFNAEDWLSHFCRQLHAGEIARKMLPERIQLAGFVEITRLEQTVIDALEGVGVGLTRSPVAQHTAAPNRGLLPTQVKPIIKVRHFESVAQELSSMAQWAKAELAAGRQRVAVIINDLDGLQDRVRQVFEDTLHPQQVLGLGAFGEGCFHLSAQATLVSQPLVRQALDLLQVSLNGCRKPLEFPLVSRLLLANNWRGAIAERGARANLELWVRQQGWYRVSLAKLSEVASGQRFQGSMPILVQLCSGLLPAAKTDPPALQLLNWLRHWGWPGEQALDETSSRAVQQFVGALETLSMQPCSGVDECLQHLQRQCDDVTIHTHGGAWSPIQVMSPAEAFGQQFERAWVGNLSDSNWPGRALANPFIPPRLMSVIPRGTDNGMLAYTERLMQSLVHCAADVIFSAANRYEDVPQGISPLLAELGAEQIEVKPDTKPEVMLSLLSAPAVAGISDYGAHPWLRAHLANQGLALPAAEARPLHGIVRCFNYQSACPLAAYLVFRLNARMPEPPGPFADAAYRGQLMHTALEHLYRPVVGTSDLPGAGDVATAVAAALRVESAVTRLMPALMEAEQTRLQRLLNAWLQQDDLRPGGQPLELEWCRKLSFAGFEFNVRIDRLDRVADDSVFIIDYKSGRVGAPAWASERLDNMQLPLYAVALAEEGKVRPVGVALAQLQLGDFKVFGVTGQKAAACRGVQVVANGRGSLAGQFENWDQLLTFWRGELGKLAQEISQGDCSHRLYNETALKYAGLEILLRNRELQDWLLDNNRLSTARDDADEL